jgi:hypothetical protein
MLMSEEIERLAVERASSEDIRRIAIAQGMRTLREDGMRKVERGITSLEEVLRIVEGRAEVRPTEEERLEAETKQDTISRIRAVN